MAFGSFNNWSPYQNYKQSGGVGPGMVDGEFVSGAFTGLFAGPPRLASLGGAVSIGAAIASPEQGAQLVYPVGIVQNLSVSHNRQISRIFELGTERSYFISGRTIGQLGLSRVMYHGPSILRVLYAYYEDLVPTTVVPAVFPNIGASVMANPHDVIVPPGYENFYLNLASDLFSQPFGMLMIVKDSNVNTYGSFYFESCYVPSHGWAVDSQGVIAQENVGIQFETCVPVATEMISLASKA